MAKSPVLLKKKTAKKKGKKRRRGRPSKLSAIELAERRQTVLTLRLKGYTYKNIAEQVGVGHMTVKRDLEQIRQENVEKASKFNRDVALGQAIASYEQVEREAWLQYHTAKQASTQKAHFLNLVRATNNDRNKLLVEVGLIGKAATRVEHKVEADGALAGWTKDAKQLVAMAILRAQLEGGEEDGKGNGKSVLELPAHMVEPVVTDDGGNGA